LARRITEIEKKAPRILEAPHITDFAKPVILKGPCCVVWAAWVEGQPTKVSGRFAAFLNTLCAEKHTL
jgi:hypothetical protein